MPWQYTHGIVKPIDEILLLNENVAYDFFLKYRLNLYIIASIIGLIVYFTLSTSFYAAGATYYTYKSNIYQY